MRRKKMFNKRKDRRVFSKTARRVHGRNVPANPMRGGYRF
jgi:hypothetical protein